MEQGRRLKWVMANRASRTLPPRIGPMIAGLVEGALVPGTEERAQLAAILGSCVDEEFRRDCRLGEVRGGTAVIQVAEPGLVSTLRVRWTSRLESALRGQPAPRAVRRVAFEFGRSGAPLSSAQPAPHETRPVTSPSKGRGGSGRWLRSRPE
jgi:hypothetical protein